MPMNVSPRRATAASLSLNPNIAATIIGGLPRTWMMPTLSAIGSTTVTDNEYAAMILGWKPTECPNVTDGPNRICWKCNKSHPAAPNMSDPRNYMKALEAIAIPATWKSDFSTALYLTALQHPGPPIVKALAEHVKAELRLEADAIGDNQRDRDR